MSEIENTFIWKIGNFQEYIERIPRGKYIFSQEFWIPQLSLIDQNHDNKFMPTLWKLCLYPNGDNSNESLNYISLFLVAIQTQYEKEKKIFKRRQICKIGVGTYEICQSTVTTVNTFIKKHSMRIHISDFSDASRQSSGFRQLVSLDSLFLGNGSKEFNFFIQIAFLDEKISDIKEISYNSKMEKYFENESFTDVEFLFDCGSKIKAHRIILAANSTYFNNMLNGQWKGYGMEAIPFKETSYEAFRAVLYFIYSGKLMNIKSFTILNNILRLSDLMMLENLKGLVSESMTKFINEKNWVEYLLYGWKFKNDFLKFTGLKFVADNWEKVKKSEGIQKLLLNINIENVEELICFVNKWKELANWDD